MDRTTPQFKFPTEGTSLLQGSNTNLASPHPSITNRYADKLPTTTYIAFGTSDSFGCILLFDYLSQRVISMLSVQEDLAIEQSVFSLFHDFSKFDLPQLLREMAPSSILKADKISVTSIDWDKTGTKIIAVYSDNTVTEWEILKNKKLRERKFE